MLKGGRQLASLWQILKQEAEKERASLITKKRFGEIMHDPNTPEWKKRQIVNQMEQQGGYENLPS